MTLKDRYAKFRLWQQTPPKVEKSYNMQRVCLNCGESYDSRFCPQCGQAGTTARLTLKNVLSHALDVWGAGNRSMPRNILHLILKPGYMIGHYLKGHRQPYFPPFKMLFIFAATFVLIVEMARWNSGYVEPPTMTIVDTLEQSVSDNTITTVAQTAEEDKDQKKQEIQRHKQKAISALRKAMVWLDRNRALGILFFQFFVAVGMWLFFRNSPRIGELALSEQMFIQVFISSQILLISTVFFLISLSWKLGGIDDLPWYIIGLIYVIDYKQLFGYSWIGTFLRAFIVWLLIQVATILLGYIFAIVILTPTLLFG